MRKRTEPPYVGESVREDAGKILMELEKRRIRSVFYAVTLAANGTDHLDIISSQYLRQKALLSSLPPLAGLARTKSEALSLIVRITEDCLRKTGGTDLRNYLESRCIRTDS